MPLSLYKSLRVRQWVKNGVMLAPLLFSGKGNDPAAVASSLFGVSVMCLASSGAYLLNDLVDHEADGFHPRKKYRPIASGALSRRAGTAWMLTLLVLALGLSWWWQASFGVAVLSYLLLSAAYSFVLRGVVILDVITLALCFVVRVWAGAVVIGVMPSPWLQLSMFCLALFMSLAKRRQELVALQGEASRHRTALASYNQPFMDQLITMMTSVTVLCYALYTMAPDITGRVGSFGLLPTVPIVIYGVVRYLYLVYVRHQALDPTDAVLSDAPLLGTVIIWTLCIVILLYH